MLAGLGPMADPVRVAPLAHTRALPALLPAPFAPVIHIPILRALQRQARARAALSNHRRRLAAMPSASVRATAVTTGKMQLSVMPARRDLTVKTKTAQYRVLPILTRLNCLIKSAIVHALKSITGSPTARDVFYVPLTLIALQKDKARRYRVQRIAAPELLKAKPRLKRACASMGTRLPLGRPMATVCHVRVGYTVLLI